MARPVRKKQPAVTSTVTITPLPTSVDSDALMVLMANTDFYVVPGAVLKHFQRPKLSKHELQLVEETLNGIAKSRKGKAAKVPTYHPWDGSD